MHFSSENSQNQLKSRMSNKNVISLQSLTQFDESEIKVEANTVF